MKVHKVTIGATIATGQYQNISPVIEISEVDNIQEASQYGMEWIKEHFARFSIGGTLAEKDIELTPQKKSLLTKI